MIVDKPRPEVNENEFIDLGKLQPDTRINSRRVIWKGAKLCQIEQPGDGQFDRHIVVSFEKLDGDWPTLADLMTIADGRVPRPAESHPGHFGGTVRFTGNKAQVKVWTD